MNYENMSDHRVNALVTSAIFDCEQWEFNDDEFYHCGIDGGGYFSQPVINYCTRIDRAWPIIIENNISLCFSGSECSASSRVAKGLFIDEVSSFTDKNPLRAAMIVFLMMKK